MEWAEKFLLATLWIFELRLPKLYLILRIRPHEVQAKTNSVIHNPVLVLFESGMHGQYFQFWHPDQYCYPD